MLDTWGHWLGLMSRAKFWSIQKNTFTPRLAIFEGLHCRRTTNFMYKIPLILLLWEMVGYWSKMGEEELPWRAKSGFLDEPHHFTYTLRRTQRPINRSQELLGQLECLITSRPNFRKIETNYAFSTWLIDVSQSTGTLLWRQLAN